MGPIDRLIISNNWEIGLRTQWKKKKSIPATAAREKGRKKSSMMEEALWVASVADYKIELATQF